MYRCCKGKIYDHNNLMEKCHHVNVKGQKKVKMRGEKWLVKVDHPM